MFLTEYSVKKGFVKHDVTMTVCHGSSKESTDSARYHDTLP